MTIGQTMASKFVECDIHKLSPIAELELFTLLFIGYLAG
jgi:hypothetical protein